MTLASLMNSRRATSRLVAPLATSRSTSSSRSLRGSTTGARTWPSSRAATDGDSTDSPRAAAPTARNSSSWVASLSR